jgi:SAM-dependent methyltransferase
MTDVTETIPAHDANVSPGGPLRQLLNELHTAAGALAGLSAELEARAAGRALEPGLAPAVHDLLEALGVRGSLEELAPAELRSMLAEVRVLAASHRQLSAPVPAEPGWAPACSALIQAAGDVSSGLPRLLERTIVPALAGLGARLGARGARFLDIGAGAGVLSIEMARTWPELAVVGVEPWAPALELAQANVLAAGLQARIELRAQRAESLADEASYDLAWLPSFFVPPVAMGAILARVRRALRDGGWLILPVSRTGADTRGGSVLRLRAALWGGSALSLADAADRLAAAGFGDLHSFASSRASPTALLAARAGTLIGPGL